MKLWTISLTGLSILSLVICGVLAQTPGERQPSDARPGSRSKPSRERADRPFDPMRTQLLMQALDTNGDGELSAEEIAGATQALKKLDKNNDGKISSEELRSAQPASGRGGPGGTPPYEPAGRGGPGGPGGPGGGQQASMETAPTPKDDAESKILKALEAIPKKEGWMLNVPTTDGRMLRLLTEAVGAKNVVEIGTSNGMSSIWFALALRTTGGKLITHEIDPKTAKLARENFESAGVSDLITVVEGDAHETVSKLKGPIDVVFIDADKPGYLDYFKKLLPLVRPGGLILAHNMTPRMADAAFLKAITTSPDVETLFYSPGGGMSLSLKKR